MKYYNFCIDKENKEKKKKLIKLIKDKVQIETAEM